MTTPASTREPDQNVTWLLPSLPSIGRYEQLGSEIASVLGAAVSTTSTMSSLRSQLPELASLEALVADLPHGCVETLAEVRYRSERFPIHAIRLGSRDPAAPAIAFVGGVHGLERVGTQVLLSYLRTLRVALSWDGALRDMLRSLRVLMVPMVNPVGMALRLRSNGQGVDLMRNAPVEAEDASRFFELHRGQRLTPYLPWYRGRAGSPMEVESRALCDFAQRELFSSACAVVIDVHSSFLAGDRLWFPYARTREPFEAVAEITALANLLAETHEDHVYTVEPQAINYTTHGDLWDYVYQCFREGGSSGVLLPLTLEISSRRWYRKNPRQLVDRLGLFHPVKAHRLARVLRRHRTLFDFLLRATLSHRRWLPSSDAHRSALQREAQKRWFSGG